MNQHRDLKGFSASGTEPDAHEAAPVEVVRYEPDDQISLAWLLTVVIRHRYLIALLTVAVATLAVGVVLLTFTPSYTAHASFMPRGNNQARLGGLEALADRFGIGAPMMAGGASPGFYANLLDSPEILRPVLMDTFNVVVEEDGALVPFNGPLLDLLNEEITNQAMALERGVRWLRGVTEVSVSGATGVVALAVTTGSPELSAQVADHLLATVNEFNLKTMQSQAAAEREFMETRLDQVGQELRAAEENLKQFLEQNRNFQNSPELRFQHERLQRQVDLRQQNYLALLQSYEQARLSEVRNTPVITVLERPVEPAERNPRGLVQTGLLALALGFVLGGVVAFGREFSNRENVESGDLRELKRVLGEAGEDIRRLLPGIGRSETG